MRKLLWFAIGFAAVCALFAYELAGNWILPLAAAVLVGLLPAVRKWRRLRILSIMALGALAAVLWVSLFQKYYLLPASRLDGAEQQTVITATDYSYATDYGTAVDGTLVIDGRKYPVRIFLEEGLEAAPGDTLRGTFRFRTTVPGGEAESAYHQGKGIFLLGYCAETPEIQKAGELSLRDYPAVLTRRIKGILGEIFPGDVSAFVRALLLGDSTGLDYETDTNLKLSGIRHIIAVSGLHISVLYGAIATLTGRKRFLTALIAAPVLVLFAAMVGFTPSVTRACIMVGVMMLATILQQVYDPLSALGFACLVMLALNPLTITSISFQLSVLCVAGILQFQPGIRDYLMERFPGRELWRKWVISSISVSCGAMIPVTPLCAVYFGTVSLIGVVTNLLTLWLVSGIFVGILVACLVSLFSLGAASVLGWLLAWPIRLVLLIAKLCAAVPFGAVYTASSYIVFWLIFCYLLLAVFLLQRNRRPGLLGCCAGLGLCLALALSWGEPLTEDVRITMLDVGQGQSILLQSRGNTFLVDCGGDSDGKTADIISQTLLSQGIARLDGMILTHYDRDHAGALEKLLTRVDTDLLILPDTPNKMQPPSWGGEIHYLWDTTQITFDGGKITVYGPIFHGESNENSLCVLFESEKCDILITGDRTDFGERMLLRKSKLTDVDILVAGHHGAESSSSRELLSVTKPELVLISVGEDSFYGHPNSKLLSRLQEAGIAVRRTDLEGTIIIRR